LTTSVLNSDWRKIPVALDRPERDYRVVLGVSVHNKSCILFYAISPYLTSWI